MATFRQQMTFLMWKQWLVFKKKCCINFSVLILPIGIFLLLTLIVVILEEAFGAGGDGDGDGDGESETCHQCSWLMSPDLLYLCDPQKPIKFGYSPDNDNRTTKIMQSIKDAIESFQSCTVMLEHYANAGQSARYDGDFFISFDLMSKVYKYAITPGYDDYKARDWELKYDAPYAPPTKELRSAGPDYTDTNEATGKVPILQKLIGDAIIQIEKDNATFKTNVYVQPFPYPPLEAGEGSNLISGRVGMIYEISFAALAVVMTKNIILEKERKLKETMKMMGVSVTSYWLSWVLTMMVYLVFSMVCVTTILKMKLFPDMNLFLFLSASLVYAVSLISFIVLMSTLFQKANIGAMIMLAVYMGTMLQWYTIERHYDSPRSVKLALPLVSNWALNIIMFFFMYREGEGVQWSNINDPLPYDDISLLEVMMATLVGAFIMLLLAWYIDNVWPGESGVPKPPHFFVTKTYWCPKKETAEHQNLRRSSVVKTHNKYFDKEPDDLRPGIEIHNLTKTFGKKTVVNGINLTMYEGQITVLLGHNGAGKTTTMSMLTGFLAPSSGTAVINGCDIRKDIEGVRRNLGLCPQHNVLFDNLTVKEHLKIFAYLKGVPRKELANTVAVTASETGLSGSVKVKSKQLSGGQKRKLSVGIALVGGSKVVILDEPSAGMDVDARRQMWELLQQARHGRTMLLSTHYMDEADVLGDRIAIMAAGVIKCCGGSPFLKKLYGVGYRLIAVKDRAGCNVNNLTRFIVSYVANAKIESDGKTEITYRLPDQSSNMFPELFMGLDSHKTELMISGYGLSETTMEEVFLKVGERVTIADSAHDLEKSKEPDSKYDTNVNKDETYRQTLTENTATPPEMSNSSRTVSSVDQDEELRNLPQTRKSTMLSNKSRINESDRKNSQGRSENNNSTGIVGHETTTNNVASPSVMALRKSQTKAMFIKKVIMILRSPISSATHVLLPMVTVFLVVFLAHLSQDQRNQPSRHYHTISTLNEQTKVPYLLCKDTTKAKHFASIYKELLSSRHKPIEVENTHSISTHVCYEEGPHDCQNTTDAACGAKDFEDYVLNLAKKEDDDNEYDFLKYNREVIIGMRVVTEKPEPRNEVKAVAYFAQQAFHSLPISMDYMMNAMLRFHTEDNSLRIKSSLVPPESTTEADGLEPPDDYNDSVTFIVGGLVIAMLLHTSWYILNLIREQQVGAKHMQLLSGVTASVYWIPTFLTDFCVYLTTCLLMFIAFVAMGEDAYIDKFGPAFLTFFLYGLATLVFIYSFHFVFKTPQNGMIASIFLQLFVGIGLAGIVAILWFVAVPFEDDNTILKVLSLIAKILDRTLALMFPIYSFLDCLCGIYKNWHTETTCVYLCALMSVNQECSDSEREKCEIPGKKSLGVTVTDLWEWEYPGISLYLTHLAIHVIFFTGLIIVFENKLLTQLLYKFKGTQEHAPELHTDLEDEDVAEERRILQNIADPSSSLQYSIMIKNITKRFKKFTAVDNICVGVEDCECFGLLGVNGAGKTTTFKMLTGDVLITSGNIYVKGLDTKTQIRKIQPLLGYCPQFDALIREMTGVETLKLYGRLRGVPEGQLNDTVNTLIKRVMLEEHANKQCGKYSGGNMRKLSTAMALIGDPPIVLLDEPTAGMDPEARRYIWNVISDVRKSGRTMVLTSHSMEECEALCTKVAIMIKGKFRCLGSTQHLKNRFGQGYTLVIQMRLNEDNTYADKGPVSNHIFAQIPLAKLFDEHQGYLHIQIPVEAVNLAQLFHLMEWAKENLNVQNYSVSQASLEQLFLALCRE